MTNELTTVKDGELRADGRLIISKTEKPNAWLEVERVGRVRIRGEKYPRSINYGDYAKLMTFYGAQERMVKDRKHIMVVLSDGSAINTADITSLELADEEKLMPKLANVPADIRNLPTAQILLSLDGKVMSTNPTRTEIMGIDDQDFYLAMAHYREEDGKREYITELDLIPEALEMTPMDEPGYEPMIIQTYRYGIPQRDLSIKKGPNSQK